MRGAGPRAFGLRAGAGLASGAGLLGAVLLAASGLTGSPPPPAPAGTSAASPPAGTSAPAPAGRPADPGAADTARAADRVRAGTFRYRVLFRGRELATLSVDVERTADGGLRVREQLSGALGDETTRYTTTAGVSPVSATRTGQVGPVSTELHLSYAEGRVTGRAVVPVDEPSGSVPPDVREVSVERELPRGTVDGNMVLVSIMASRLEEGSAVALDVFRPGDGVVRARAEVVGRERVEVPAGGFPAWRVELATDQGAFTVWVPRSPPRMLLRQTFRDRPVEVVLEEVVDRP